MNKQLPQDLQAEVNLLGSILTDNNVLLDVIDIVKVDNFYNAANKIIYENMIKMFQENIPMDITTLINQIGVDKIKSVGGVTYISSLISSTTTALNAKNYALIVKEKADRRKIIKTAQETLEKAYGQEEVKKIVASLSDDLLSINDNTDKKILTDAELMGMALETIESNMNNPGQIIGMKTGYISLDKALGGFVKGDMTIVGARPSMGKTLWSMNIINKLSKLGRKIAVFELEMTPLKLAFRRLSAEAMINSTKLQQGVLDEKEIMRIAHKVSEIASRNNVLVDTRMNITMEEIRATCKKIKLQFGLDEVLIDHMGLVTPSKNFSSKNQEIEDISRKGKMLAKDLDLHVTFLNQLSRSVEQRADKRPMLSDLRDSGAIEQDADQVIFLYRDAYYNPETEERNIIENIIAKNRDGKTGTIKFYTDLDKQLMEELDFRRN